MTPELEDRVCLTAALTGSYEAAAQVSAKWGSAVDDETIRAHVRRVGQRAEAQAQAHYVTKARGGHGAVREVVTLILKAQRRWAGLVEEYCQ
jgi:3-deoxy-D-manno-octulosonate 8-phosphate phosphatase KdsC-like HAD superfamily phosphatase